MNLDVANVMASLAISCYLIASWNSPLSLPIMVIIGALWFASPWVILAAKLDVWFVRLRVVQFCFLLVAALISTLSPVPASHFQEWAKRTAAKELRPIDQQEVTSIWKTLQWFTQEGAPAVWYSFDQNTGYRLFAAPGHDPATNQELQAVGDAETRNRVVAYFRVKEEGQARQARFELEQAEAASRANLIREYVTPSYRDQKSPAAGIALFVLAQDGRGEGSLSEDIANALTSAGIQNSRSIFTAAYLRSETFQQYLNGTLSLNRSFRTEDYAAQLLIVRTRVSFSRNEPIDSVAMTAANMIWTIQLITAADGQVIRRKEINVKGIGFHESNAKENAVQRAKVELQKIAPSIVTP